MKALTSLNLSFGLLTLPLRIYPIRDSNADNIDFVGLSNCCHSVLKAKKFCSVCSKETSWRSDLKGYKIGKQYIELTKEELETIEKLENGIEILYFSCGSLPLAIFDKPYFLEPTANYKLYDLLNNLFAELNLVAVCRSVVKGNEHFAVLRHDKKGLILQYIERVTDLNIEYKKVDYSKAEYLQLKQIIEQNLKEFDFNELKNSYADKVKKLIEQKAEGKTIDITKIETKELQESNLLEQLKAMTKQKVEKVV